MKSRIITALLIILVCVVPVFYGGIFLQLLIPVVVGIGGYEWMHIQPESKDWPVYLMPAIILFTYIGYFIPIEYVISYLCLGVALLWSLPIWQEKFTLANSFSTIVYFVFFTLLLYGMRYITLNHYYLTVIVFATYGSDTGAWFIGRKYGKHKMNPRVSPKKSWEGFGGGVAFGFILGLIITLIFRDQLNMTFSLLLSLICPITAEVGDLCFSLIKRYYGVKDFSNLLPGHGGILDRVDSLLLNLVMFTALCVFFI